MPLLQEDWSQEDRCRHMGMQEMRRQVHWQGLRDLIMATYKCFDCGKVVKKEYLKKKIRCPYCGSKILFKPRTATTTVIAR